MLVQYEDRNQAPPLSSSWSWQDSEGSGLLITLAWIGVLIGVGGALYWARLSILGAMYSSKSDAAGFTWLAIVSSGAAIIAPVLWPFLKTRRPEIATFVLVIGVICWLLTSALGTMFLIEKSERQPAPNESRPMPRGQIEASIEKDRRSIADAERDCFYQIWRGCDWLNSNEGVETRARLHRSRVELERPKQPRPPVQTQSTDFDLADAISKLRSRFMLFLTVALGGSITLALIWGPAEALKGMYSEPGAMASQLGNQPIGLPMGSTEGIGMPNPIDMAFRTWASQCLERARGERVPLATLHAHYVAWCMRRHLPTFASDAAFGRALNRARDPMDPSDLGGPMGQLGGYPLKTGRMEYVDVRIRPDDILDEIEGHLAGP